MLSGLEILLARMKDYPEEFTNPDGVWRRMIKDVLPYLDKDEMVALEYGIKEIMRDKFNESVLSQLAGVGVQQPEQGKSASVIASTAMKQQALAKQSLAMMNAQFDHEYKKYDAQRNQAFNPYNVFKP
jgi:hypothetical protein